jgi:hypothetical protein
MWYDEMLTQLCPAALTAFFAVLVFVAGQVVIKFFVEPIHRQSEVIGEIAHSLNYHANVFGKLAHSINPRIGERADEAVTTYRDLASKLRASTATIKWYGFWAFLKLVPKHTEIEAASSRLIYLSNVVFGDDRSWEAIHEAQEAIRKALHLRF